MAMNPHPGTQIPFSSMGVLGEREFFPVCPKRPSSQQHDYPDAKPVCCCTSQPSERGDGPRQRIFASVLICPSLLLFSITADQQEQCWLITVLKWGAAIACLANHRTCRVRKDASSNTPRRWACETSFQRPNISGVKSPGAIKDPRDLDTKSRATSAAVDC